jgi:UDP-3-O-[3-hydroxymyristoyl] glucosamine N-acyltransferase
MQLSAKKIAAFLDGILEGNPDVEVDHPSKIEEGGKGSISFLGNPKYEKYAYSTNASVLLVPRNFEPKQPVSATLVRVDDVYDAIAQLLEHFGAAYQREAGISDKASVSQQAKLGEEITVGAFSSIGEGSSIGANSVIHEQVHIGKDVTIGAHTVLYPGVRVLDRCRVGDHCILHSNVVVGSDGFGFTPQQDGSYKKILHVGNVVIEDRVEIGAQSAIDRGTMGSTVIREGVKMDNLIQVGHNVEIGAHTVIAAQTGIAGSTKIGKHCRIGGQVGFAGHLEIADGTQIQAQSGIASNVKEPNQALFGSPAFAYRDFVRSHAVFKKLPELYRKLHALEKAVKPPSDQ